MKAAHATFIWVVAILWLCWQATALFDNHDQAEIERACGNAGVQQILSTWIDPSISGSLTVVCRDGRVVKVS